MEQSVSYSRNALPGATVPHFGSDAYESAFVYFRNNEGQYFDPVEPKVWIERDNKIIPVRTLAAVYPDGKYELKPTEVAKKYYFRFYSQMLPHGLYKIKFSGKDPEHLDLGEVIVQGGFTVASSTVQFEYIRRLRQRLMDALPQYYQLINNKVTAWDDDHLLTYIEDALNEFNAYPPMTRFTLLGVTCYSLILEGAFSLAVRAMAVRETWNTLQYNDELSFTIDRFAKFEQLGNAAYARFKEGIGKYKDYFALYGDDTAGDLINGASGDGSSADDSAGSLPGSAAWMGNQEVPLQINRVLSWMPNSQAIFGI